MRKAVLSAIIVLAMLTSVVPASAGTITNSHTWGLPGETSGTAVAVDAAGNVFVAGVNLNGVTYISFIAKFNNLGQLLWDRTMSVSQGWVWVYDMAVDDAGNAYVVGDFFDQLNGTNCGHVTKFAPDGSLVYSISIGNFYEPWEIEVDSIGFVITGDAGGPYGVAAFTADGSPRWYVTGWGNGTAMTYGLAVDSLDNVIVTLDRSDYESDVGFAMFDRNGAVLRQVVYASGYPEEYSWDVTVGSDGFVYALGWSTSEYLLLLIKLTPTLDFVWGEKIGNPSGYQECWKMVAQPDGTIYAIGQADDVNAGVSAPAVFHFSSSGALLEASYYGISRFADAAALPLGGFAIAGQAMETYDLTPTPVPGVTVTPVADMMADDDVVFYAETAVVAPSELIVGDPSAYVDTTDPSVIGQAWFGLVDAVVSQFPVEISVRQSSSNPNHVTFRGSASGGDRPYSYTWHLGDGNIATGQRVPYDYTSSGVFHVTLVVQDSVGKVGMASVDVMVPGPPVIGAVSCTPADPLVNQTTTFTVSAYDPDGGALMWFDWSYGDGTTARTSTGSVDHVYTAVGTYTLSVTAVDDEGLGMTSLLTFVVSAFNSPPRAVFTVTPASGNTSTVFVANASTVSDMQDPSSALVVRWDWESDGYWDTNWSTNKVATHMFFADGTYYISLEVMDTGGLKNNTTRAVVVNSSDWTTLLYEPFDSWDTLDPFWTITNASYLDFRNWFVVQDGLLLASNNGVLAYDHYLSYANWTRPFNYSGELEISFSIYLPLDYNEKIGWSGQVFWVILYDTSGYAGLISRFVMDYPGDTADIGWVNWQGEEPVEICPFYAGWHEVSMRMSATSLYWTPTFDGVVQPQQMFRAPSGSFEVGKIAFVNALREEVQVVALDTVEVKASGLIFTPNLPPVASFTVTPQYAHVGDPVTFDATSSYDPDGNITEWGWEYGDGTEGGDEVVAHAFTSPGTYNATLTVWDDEGASDTATATIVVMDVGERANWTFLVYEDGDNNLEEVAITDFLEMSSVGSTSNVNIVVQMDRIDWGDTSYGDWTDTKRFYVTQGMTPTASSALMDMGELNMGDPSVLRDFVEWGTTSFPAENYMLVLWDHGGGWDGAVCWDDTDYGDALTLDELQTAIRASELATGEWIDSVGFDACLMGMAEVAYEIKDCTDVIVFSEEVVPWDGWPYDTIMADLVGNPSMDIFEFGTCIVNRYAEYYGSNYSETMSVANVVYMDYMFQNLDTFARELIACLPTYKGELIQCINDTEYFSYYEYKDLHDFAWEVITTVPVLSLQSAAWGLMFSLNATIGANFTGQWHPDAHGLSIYLPSSSSSYMWSYENLDMSMDLMWDEFLVNFSYTEADGYEPDDTYLQANQIVPGVTQVHTIDDWGLDVDWVTFTLSEVTQVRIATSGPPDMGDSVLRLYNQSGVPDWSIAENDDYNNSLWSQITAWLGPGVYWVEVSSYDHQADIPYYELTLTYGPFPNEPPVAQWYWYGSPNVGQNVYFDGSYSFDPDGYIVGWLWDLGDGYFEYSSWVSHVYYAAGQYMVTLTVTDDQGATSSSSGLIQIYEGNSLPVPVAVIYPQNPTVGETVTFDGTQSYDPDGYITNWYWYLGDGSSAWGAMAYHSYSNPGTYYIELQVSDNSGQWSWTSINLTVREGTPVPPVAVIAYSPSLPMVWQAVQFDGSYSVDPDGYITTWIWQFGDGTVGYGAFVTHTYQHPGIYTVSLSVIDAYGLSDDTYTTIRVVSAPNANFEYSPLMPIAGQQTNFYAWGSSDQSGIVEYIWSFGDGTYGYGWQASHVFSAAGSYPVTLTVRNSDGMSANHTEIVTVANAQQLTLGGSSVSGSDLGGASMSLLLWVALVGAYVAGSGAVAWKWRR